MTHAQVKLAGEFQVNPFVIPFQQQVKLAQCAILALDDRIRGVNRPVWMQGEPCFDQPLESVAEPAGCGERSVLNSPRCDSVYGFRFTKRSQYFLVFRFAPMKIRFFRLIGHQRRAAYGLHQFFGRSGFQLIQQFTQVRCPKGA